MARKRATLADLLNDLTYRCIYNKYKLIALNAFEWEGLPEGILERHIETKLFEHGKAIFIKDRAFGFKCLKAQNGQGINIDGDPVNYRAIGYGYNKEYPADKVVVIENNKLRLPTRDFLTFYAAKLAEAERTMDVNVKANKTPIIVLCDDKDVLSFKRLISLTDGNVPTIYADKGLNLDAIQALDLKVQFLCNDLMTYKQTVENELLTFLGQNNTPHEKKERLITDEANSNNDLIASFLELQLEARKRACEEINALFGLNISVKRREGEEVRQRERLGSDSAAE
jgi:hypothetical protein